MGAQLKNTLSFNLVGGASVVLTHNLQTDARPLAPDIIFVPSKDIVVDASDTDTITIRNAGGDTLAGVVLVEAWHTIERLFGEIRTEDLPTKPYVVIGTESVESDVLAPVTTIVFRPGDPAGDRENVYTTWAGAYAAIVSVRNLGQVYLEFDARFGAVHIPAGAWIMNDVIWTDYHRDGIETRVTLDDGASIQITTPGPTLQVVGDSLAIVSDRTGPTAPFVGVNLLLGGVRTRFYNTSALALPAFVVTGSGGFIGFKDCPLGGVGNDAALPAPLIDVNGISFTAVGFSGHIDDNALTGNGTFNLRLLNDNFNGGLGAVENYSFPAFTGTINVQVRARDRHRVETTVIATPYNAVYNELVRVDTSTLAITVNAPRANPAKGERLVVKDATGNAAALNITIAGTGGDTVEDNVISVNGQAKTWISDGAGKWLHIATS